MGVGGNFWDLLRPCMKRVGPDDFRGKRVAIDLSFWIVQQETAVANSKTHVRKPHIRLTFFRTINLFSKYGICPVFVVDGTPSQLKTPTRIARFFRFSGFDASVLPISEGDISAERNKKFLNLVHECSELVSLLGMPLLKANGEAEGLCAQLNREGHADACITADSDAFLYGALCVIKSINHDSEEPFECYYMTDIESELKLKRNHLIAISILVGNDHNLKGVPGIGIDTSMRFAHLFGDDEILDILLASRDGAELPIGDSSSVDESHRKNSSKLSHCMFCGHPGSKKIHKKSSCEYCGNIGGESCKKKLKGFKCPCSSCEKLQNAKAEGMLNDLKLIVTNKIRMLPSLPIAEVSELYLCSSHGNYSDGNLCLTWSGPNVDLLIDFLAFHLHFEPSYTRKKLFPVLSTIYLRNKAVNTDENLLYDQYEFHSIQGIKVRRRNKFFLVRWRKDVPSASCSALNISVEDSDGEEEASEVEETEEIGDKDVNVINEENGIFILTEENIELVSCAFPEEANQFLKQKEENELNRLKQKDIGESQSSGMQLQITEFYRSIKVQKPLKQFQVASSDSPNKRSRKSEETSRLPKSARRRLLFG